MAALALPTLTLAVFLVFVPGLDDAFGPPKAAVIRIAGLALLAALLASGAGPLRRLRDPMDWAWLAWLGAEVLATLFSTSPRTSFWGDSHQPEGLLTSVGLTGLYAATRIFLRSREARRSLWGGLTLAGVAACLYPLMQMAGMDPLSWERTAVLQAGDQGRFRMFGTFGHPNELGVVTAACLPVAATLFAVRRRWALAVATALLGWVTIATLSRAAWLGALIGTVTAIGLAVSQRSAVRPSRRQVIGAATTTLVVWGLLAAWSLQGPLEERFHESLALGTGSAASRMEIWKAALAAWKDRPWLGHGPDTFGLVFPRFQTTELWRIEWASHPRHAHSIYLNTLATRGVLGLLTALAVVGTLAGSWKRARGLAHGSDPVTWPAATGMLVALAVSGAFGALGLSGALLVVVAVAAMTGAAEDARNARPDPKARGSRAPSGPSISRNGWIAGSVVAASLLGASVLQLRALHETQEAWQTRIRAAPTAAALARQATRAWPAQDYPNRVLADALAWLAMGQPQAQAQATILQAEQAARRAVELVPVRAENAFILGRAIGIREVLGDTSARAPAQAAYERALQLAPLEARMAMEYAEHERIMGRIGNTIALLETVTAVYPDEGSVQYRLGAALLADGRADEARAALTRAVESPWHEALAERAEAAHTLAAIRGPTPPAPP